MNAGVTAHDVVGLSEIEQYFVVVIVVVVVVIVLSQKWYCSLRLKILFSIVCQPLVLGCEERTDDLVRVAMTSVGIFVSVGGMFFEIVRNCDKNDEYEIK